MSDGSRSTSGQLGNGASQSISAGDVSHDAQGIFASFKRQLKAVATLAAIIVWRPFGFVMTILEVAQSSAPND